MGTEYAGKGPRYRPAMPPLDLTDTEPDHPIGKLMTTPDHAARQELLPDAVEQAAQFAARMRESIAVRSGATDPDLVRLVQRMRPSVDVHEAFAARWADAAVDDESWLELGLDLHRLLREWAELVEIMLPAADTAEA